jgi:hypothetical protein
MLIQTDLSEDEIRALNYKRFRENNPILQIRLHGGLSEIQARHKQLKKLKPEEV